MGTRDSILMGKYRISAEVFRTKREIVAHVRGILARTQIGSELAPADRGFMLSLLQRHPSASRKIGPGIRAIRVDLNTHWAPQKAFVLVRIDGSETDFSYYSCIYPSAHDAKFCEACRQAVVADVLAFKKRFFETAADEFNEVACAVTGERVSWNDAHVDHAPPWTFKTIVNAFVGEQGIDVAAVPLAGDGDNEWQSTFADPAMSDRFRHFHNERARLRLVTRTVNLRRQG
jgi:hypothetical protein